MNPFSVSLPFCSEHSRDSLSFGSREIVLTNSCSLVALRTAEFCLKADELPSTDFVIIDDFKLPDESDFERSLYSRKTWLVF